MKKGQTTIYKTYR